MPKILAGTARLMAVSARRGVSREILGTIVYSAGKTGGKRGRRLSYQLFVSAWGV
jgi:hypothetical protein